MEEFKKIIIHKLATLDISNERIRNEQQFEDFVFEKLKILIKNYDRGLLTFLNTQIEFPEDNIILKPDIIIGSNDEIIIELKFNIKSRDEIYRLFYQAIKYSKLANELLILFSHDPNKIITETDIRDLESFEKVKVIRIFH